MLSHDSVRCLQYNKLVAVVKVVLLSHYSVWRLQYDRVVSVIKVVVLFWDLVWFPIVAAVSCLVTVCVVSQALCLVPCWAFLQSWIAKMMPYIHTYGLRMFMSCGWPTCTILLSAARCCSHIL